MKELLQEWKEEDSIIQLCEDRSLSMSILKPLFIFSMQGFNNAKIAQRIGVHRITIQRYSAVLRKLTESQFQGLYRYVLVGTK